MENENQKSHEKRFFASLSAKKKVLLAVIAFLLLIGFLSSELPAIQGALTERHLWEPEMSH